MADFAVAMAAARSRPVRRAAVSASPSTTGCSRSKPNSGRRRSLSAPWLRADRPRRSERAWICPHTTRQVRTGGDPEQASAGRRSVPAPARPVVRLAEDRFNLVVVGRFSRGKSSLMNAILGRYRLPTGVVPLTSVITTVTYGSEERVTLHFRGSGLIEDIQSRPASRLRHRARQSRQRPPDRGGGGAVAGADPAARLRFRRYAGPGVLDRRELPCHRSLHAGGGCADPGDQLRQPAVGGGDCSAALRPASAPAGVSRGQQAGQQYD